MEKMSEIFNNNNDFISEVVINEVYTRFVKSIIPHDENEAFIKTIPNISVVKMHTEDFLKKITSSNSEILPTNCRYMEDIGGYTVYVIEDTPRLRTVRIDLRLDSEIEYLKSYKCLEEYGYENFLKENPNPPYKFQLSFPYIVYIMFFDKLSKQFIKLHVFYRLHPIFSKDDYMLQCNLLNVGNPDGGVCLGERAQGSKYATMNERIESVLNAFWANEFNKDITSSYKLYQDQKEISTILAWKYFSKIDPMFIFGVKWKQIESNLYEFIRRHTKGNVNNSDAISRFHKFLSEDLRPDSSIVQRTQILNCIPLFKTGVKGCDYLEVGSEIELNNVKYYVYGIIKKSNGIHQVELEDEEGKKSKVTADDKFIQEVKDYITKRRSLKSIEIDGLTISSGTILELNDSRNGRKLKEVNEILKARDGKIEVRCGTTTFIVGQGQLVGAKIFDKSNICFKNGMKAIIGNYYTITNNDSLPMYPIYFVKLLDIRVQQESIYYIFESLLRPSSQAGTYDSNFSDITEYNANFAKKSSVPVFRIGTSILNNNDKVRYNFHLLDDGFGVSDRHGLSFGTSFDGYALAEMAINTTLMMNEILKDNKLTIKSFDIDIEFSIGDTVVIADYTKPLEYVTKIRTISNFRVDTSGLYIETLTDDNIKEEVQYIVFSNKNTSNLYYRSPKIKMGLVRKIIPEIGDFKKGVKVRAKIAGIPAFPKKDVNEIIGIIIDTGVKPIILCSNGHTIWGDEKSKDLFEFIIPNSKNYNKLELTKHDNVYIKYQSGDIVKNSSVGSNSYYFCRWSNMSKKLMYIDDDILMSYGNYGYGRTLPLTNTYQTIPMPRFSPTSEKKEFPVIPNYHGGFTIKNGSQLVQLREEI